MGHGPATDWGIDKSIKKKTRLGVKMFILYAIVYFGFIIINVVSPKTMAIDVGGLNIAIVYGVGLIVFALVLALIYNAKCTKLEKEMNSQEQSKEDSL
jgi:uncharacterized membrane protein (DUF485 family)